MRVGLVPERIIETVARLRARIDERFPGSGLGRIAGQLLGIAEDSARRADSIRRPRVGLRILIGLLLATALTVLVLSLPGIRVDFRVRDGTVLIQTAEAVLSGLVFLGAAVIFLVTLESRSKRKEALSAIEELRVLAHIVDMHQLTKDPDRVLHRGPATASSPKSELDAVDDIEDLTTGLTQKIWQKIVILDRHTAIGGGR